MTEEMTAFVTKLQDALLEAAKEIPKGFTQGT